MGPNPTKLLNQGLPPEISEELSGWSVKEWRAWLTEQEEGSPSLEGQTKAYYENWLLHLQRKIDELKELQRASEDAGQAATQEPEIAGGSSESGYNVV